MTKLSFGSFGLCLWKTKFGWKVYESSQQEKPRKLTSYAKKSNRHRASPFHQCLQIFGHRFTKIQTSEIKDTRRIMNKTRSNFFYNCVRCFFGLVSIKIFNGRTRRSLWRWVVLPGEQNDLSSSVKGRCGNLLTRFIHWIMFQNPSLRIKIVSLGIFRIRRVSLGIFPTAGHPAKCSDSSRVSCVEFRAFKGMKLAWHWQGWPSAHLLLNITILSRGNGSQIDSLPCNDFVNMFSLGSLSGCWACSEWCERLCATVLFTGRCATSGRTF